MATGRWGAAALATLVAAASLAVGCGSDEDEGTVATSASTATDAAPAAQSGTSRLQVTAQESDGLSFDPATLKAKSGTVTITMDNPGSNTMPHTVEVEGNGVEQSGDVVQPGETAKVTADLKPGTYEFYCPVDGHRQAGMEGTLTVM
jgi:plastocyanin